MKSTRGSKTRFVGLISLLLALPCSVSLAQQPITSSGLNTAVSAPIALPSGQTQFNITGGTRPGGGVNLFHSFGDFNVPNNNIANFLNNSALPTSNILGRVTGGNISNIFGTIQTTGFGNANLVLMNQGGFLFGPNATLNVGGMVAFTTADYLRLADGARFTAIPNADADALLSVAPVAAFGFLGSNPGAITVQGSQLTVAEGTGISLVGGDIQITGGTLKAPSGKINLVSIAGGGEARVNASGIAITAGTPMGNILVGANQPGDLARFDASGDEGGAVVIRGGHLSLARTEITTEARTATHTGAGIVVEATDSATLNGVILDTRASGFPDPNSVGGAGPVLLTAPSVTASNLTIDTSAFNEGPAGDVAINVGSLTSSILQIFSFVHGDSPGPASGNVSIRATGDVTLQNGTISTSAFGARDAGQIAVQAATLTLTDGISINSGSQSPQSGGRAGNIVIDVGSLTMRASQISTSSAASMGAGDAPTIVINATRNIITDNGTITAAGPGQAGDVSLHAGKSVQIHNGSLISADNTGVGDAGNIVIQAGTNFVSRGSTVSAQAGQGNGGTIQVEAHKVGLTDSQLTTSVSGGSQTVGGRITVDAKNVTLKNSQILSTATEGQGGTIDITTKALHQDPSSVIDASSQSGTDGTVTINGTIQP